MLIKSKICDIYRKKFLMRKTKNDKRERLKRNGVNTMQYVPSMFEGFHGRFPVWKQHIHAFDFQSRLNHTDYLQQHPLIHLLGSHYL